MYEVVISKNERAYPMNFDPGKCDWRSTRCVRKEDEFCLQEISKH